VFLDQIQMADVVVMNKLDTATPELVADFQEWANGLFPPKLLIAGTTHGRLDPAWLDLTASDERFPLYPDAHQHTVSETHTPADEPDPATVSGAARRFPSPPGAAAACGWVFPPTDVFDEERLLAWLRSAPHVSRLKGVFRIADDWLAANRVGTSLTVSPTAYRRDSRVELFAGVPAWDDLERSLLACLLTCP
jgi:G3E family GTPase